MIYNNEEIKTILIQTLRALTGEGIMECEKALINCEWDIEKAKVYIEQSEFYKNRI